MSVGQNPFADEGIRKASGAPATTAWIVAGALAIALIAALLLWAFAVGKVRRLESLSPKLDEANATLGSTLAQLQQSRDLATNLQDQLTELAKEKEAVGQSAKRLEDEMRSDLESKDVTISKLQGKLTVNILDRVMFDSGEAVLKPDGETVLRKVAGILAAHPELKIHVIGHTDNVPIRSRFSSNWELSTARALAAVHFLTEKAGVSPTRVGAVGYGEFRPLADNSTAAGRARNRRIAITILPDELAGIDVAPTATSPAGTNAPNEHLSSPAPAPAPAN
jgi:chemotaxis protein MotB